MDKTELKRKYPWAKFVLEAGTIVPHRVPFPLARRFQQICVTHLAEVYGHEEIIDLEYASLACVDDFPGIDQSRLAALTGIDRTSAGQIADNLEERGLLTRRVNPEDRRARVLQITPAGRKLRNRIRPKVLAAQERMLAPLSGKERMLLMDLLTRLIEANDAYARPGSGRRAPQKKTAALEGQNAEQKTTNLIGRRSAQRRGSPDLGGARGK